MPPLILASGSRFRRKMLADAGLTFETAPPDIDERGVEASLRGSVAVPDHVADALAEAKALDVGARLPGRLVLGCDQTLSLDGAILHKPTDMEAARHQILALSGRTHRLSSAAVLVRGDQVVWRHVGTAQMTMRPLAPAFVDRYLVRVGAAALESVGAYQIEGEGVQLFERVEGDLFTIVGLPLIPLLAALRREGVVDA
jgi:septum formation protein